MATKFSNTKKEFSWHIHEEEKTACLHFTYYTNEIHQIKARRRIDWIHHPKLRGWSGHAVVWQLSCGFALNNTQTILSLSSNTGI